MKISDIMKKYKNEWILIKITKTNEKDEPVEGELIFHSKNRDEVYELQKKLKGYLYVTYSGELPKKGFAVAFCGKN